MILIESVLPKEIYHWQLNPGHLTADEEWMSSPIYPGSEKMLKMWNASSDRYYSVNGWTWRLRM